MISPAYSVRTDRSELDELYAHTRDELRILTSLPSPFKIFHSTQTNCSFSLIPPELATLTAVSRSLTNVAYSTDLKGLMAIGCGAYNEYNI